MSHLHGNGSIVVRFILFYYILARIACTITTKLTMFLYCGLKHTDTHIYTYVHVIVHVLLHCPPV